MQDWGEATGSGRFSNEASTTDGGQTWTGVATTANGDQVSWEIVPGTAWFVTVTGGTGRLTGITGGWSPVFESAPVITYPDVNTVVMTYTYTSAGKVSY